MAVLRETTKVLSTTLRPEKLDFLADLTSSHSERVTNGLLSLSQVSRQVLRDEARPYVFLAVPLRSLCKLLTDITGSLEHLSFSQKDTYKKSLRRLYSFGISGDIPEKLANIELWLEESRDRCEITAWARGNIVPELDSLRRPLGLIRPSGLFWWRARAWDRSDEVKWRQMLVAMTYEVFDLMGRYCDAVDQVHQSTTAYANFEGIFRPVDRLGSIEDQSGGKSLEESLLSLRETLEKIRSLFQRLDAEYRLPYFQRSLRA
ncbi:hypothetical protein FS837_004482 [Tulasnella sp. UAMH 9824]|nr:hypothetical protein FS837_004482 [Tulasnella sp. UAMH 9824]